MVVGLVIVVQHGGRERVGLGMATERVVLPEHCVDLDGTESHGSDQGRQHKGLREASWIHVAGLSGSESKVGDEDRKALVATEDH